MRTWALPTLSCEKGLEPPPPFHSSAVQLGLCPSHAAHSAFLHTFAEKPACTHHCASVLAGTPEPPRRARTLTSPLPGPSPRIRRRAQLVPQDLSCGPSQLLAGLQGPRTRAAQPCPSRSRYPRGHHAKAPAEVSTRQAWKVSGPRPLGHWVPDGSRRNHSGTRGGRGPRPPNSLDASGAPSRPDSPLAERPHPHGHPHVRHPSASAQAWQAGPAAASPAPAPAPNSAAARPGPSTSPRAPLGAPPLRSPGRPGRCL